MVSGLSSRSDSASGPVITRLTRHFYYSLEFSTKLANSTRELVNNNRQNDPHPGRFFITI
jgi:hypothetical protein